MTTISNLKKGQVFTLLKKTILNQNIQKACYWASELDLSNYTTTIWEQMILFYCKEINIMNPNFPIYLFQRYTEFQKIVNDNIAYNQESRNKLCELIIILSLSNKKSFPKTIKIKPNDLTKHSLVSNMIKDKTQIHNKWIYSGQDTILKIVLNQIVILLSLRKKNKINHAICYEKCIYWFDLLLYYEKNLKKKKQIIKCNYIQYFDYIPSKMKLDYIWVLWNIILEFSNNNQSTLCLFKLFKSNLTKSKKTQKSILLKMAFLLTINQIPKIDYSIPIISNHNILYKAVLNINQVYNIILQKNIISTKESDTIQKITIKKNKNNKQIQIKPIDIEFNDYIQKKTFVPSNNILIKHLDKYIDQKHKYNQRIKKQNYKINKIQKIRKQKDIQASIQKTINNFKSLTNTKSIHLKINKKIKQKTTKLSKIYKIL